MYNPIFQVLPDPDEKSYENVLCATSSVIKKGTGTFHSFLNFITRAAIVEIHLQ